MELTVSVDIKVHSTYPVDRASIRAAIRRRLELQQVTGFVYVSVRVVGDRAMRKLNNDFRGKDYATDVLSFPTTDPEQEFVDGGFHNDESEGLWLGDIVVSYPQALKQATRENKRVNDVIDFLVDHSVLHLLGIHHD